MLDSIIRGGKVVDGSGNPAVMADVGIRDGRVVGVGKIDDTAKRTVNAEGKVVAPGFVDVHTHYDAQVMWDPALTPSCLHGTTTVLGGNCGFTIAPVNAGSTDYVTRMLACVEGMPVESLQAALEFKWNSFGEWLDQLDGKVALNCGFMVGHSTVRRLVMGESWKQAATQDQIRVMSGLIDDSVKDGALGFSSSWGETHCDHSGSPVPSRFADADELITLAGVLRPHPGTMLEFIPGSYARFTDEAMDVMADMSVAAGRALNWNLLSVGTGFSWDDLMARLSSSDHAAKRGGRVNGLALPMAQCIRINLLTSIAYNTLPFWGQILAQPLEQKLRDLSDPATRVRMNEAIVGRERHFTNFAGMIIEAVFAQELKPLEGRNVGALAMERGCAPLDVFLDTAIADKLRTVFRTAYSGDDPDAWQQRKRLWDDPRAIVGGSDAGAHLDTLETAAMFTDLIGPSVRDRKLLSLEQAIHKISDRPARYYGLKDRGRIEPGMFADIVLFDPETVGPGKAANRADMPGGQSRLYVDATGIDRVMVAGIDVVLAGEVTGATPGTVVRSGRDTADNG